MFFSLYCLLAGQCHKQVLVMFIQVSANTYATARWCRQNTTISAPSRRARVTARSSSSSLADRAPRWRSTPPPTPRSAQWQIYRRWQPANSLRSCLTACGPYIRSILWPSCHYWTMYGRSSTLTSLTPMICGSTRRQKDHIKVELSTWSCSLFLLFFVICFHCSFLLACNTL